MFDYVFNNNTTTDEIYTLSLHDALPISRRRLRSFAASWLLNALLRIFAMSIITPKRKVLRGRSAASLQQKDRKSGSAGMPRPISYAVFCLKKKKKNIVC